MKVLSRGDIGKDRWDAFVEQHPTGWFWHTSHWLDYSLLYTPEATDHSFAALIDEQIIALVPLIATEEALVCGGQVTPAPLFDHGIASAALVCENVMAEALRRLNGRDPLPIQLRPGGVAGAQPPTGTRVYTGMTHVVDLGLNREPDLWRNLRKSSKSLIHRAERAYHIGVYNKAWAVEAAEAVHVAASERRTRAPETWKLMASWVEQGLGLVALATHRVAPRDAPGGFALAIRYKQWSYYASGASTVADVGHALQWHLIRTLRADGKTKYYEVGYESSERSTEKEKGIAHFKAGFGGDLMPVIVVAPASWVPA